MLGEDGEQRFGELLREHRLAAGLTQAALAERAGIGTRGLQDLERSLSQPHRDTLQRLEVALGLSPDERTAFRGAARASPRRRAGVVRQVVAGTGIMGSGAPYNLPLPLSSFVGRERELDAVRRLLEQARLVTLTGAGGIGKTRLALRVAADQVAAYADGVCWVELAALTDHALVPQTVAAALGVREQPGQPLGETLAEALRPKRLLLVLDNCEHLVAAAAQLTDALLCADPGLTVLATSREPLYIPGEANWQVAPLSTPDPHEPMAVDGLTQYESVRLFIDRAGLAQPSFAVTTQSAPALAEVCHQLDGIPLAIELAAARVKLLTVEQIAARLNDRFGLLVGGSRTAQPRHQTLRGAIDWSYDLLTDAERQLFHRLAVFAGGWTLEAAEAVCAGGCVDSTEVLELLGHLVNKSLAVAEEDLTGAKRYHLLDTLRQYGRERLLASGESDAVRVRHATYYLTSAECAEPQLGQRRQAAWIERLGYEQSEIRAALDWLVTRGEVQQALRLAGVMSRFWEVRGQLNEGRARLAALLGMPGASAPTVARAKVLDGAAVLALYQFDVAAARALFKESLTLYREHQEMRGIAWVLIHLGWLCHDIGRWRAGRRFLLEALAWCRQQDDRRSVARCLTILGMIAFAEVDFNTARSHYEESLALNREIGDRWGTAWAFHNVGRLRLAQAELGQADAHSAQGPLEESVAIWREIGERRHFAFATADLAVSLAWQGQHALARAQLDEALTTFVELQDRGGKVNVLFNCSRLFVAESAHPQSARLLAAIGDAVSPAKGKYYWPCFALLTERRLEASRRAVGSEVVAAAFAEGEAMSLDAAIAYAHQQLRISEVLAR